MLLLPSSGMQSEAMHPQTKKSNVCFFLTWHRLTMDRTLASKMYWETDQVQYNTETSSNKVDGTIAWILKSLERIRGLK